VAGQGVDGLPLAHDLVDLLEIDSGDVAILADEDSVEECVVHEPTLDRRRVAVVGPGLIDEPSGFLELLLDDVLLEFAMGEQLLGRLLFVLDPPLLAGEDGV
jgi:hypothetical protein